MDLSANESQHSDNKSNISAELQHFPNDKSDYNVTSQDYIFAFEKKDGANTNANKKHKLLNKKQRSCFQKISKI